jgi:DNA-binding NarL/FixJ family response regulator/tetratricopeptide (TPR) repeat protein
MTVRMSDEDAVPAAWQVSDERGKGQAVAGDAGGRRIDAALAGATEVGYVTMVARRRFVGRTVEVEALGQAVDRARRGMPGVVVVVGDAGAGKTTLVSEAAARTGARLLVGHCVRVGAHGLALAAVADLARQISLSADRGLLEGPEFEPLVRVAKTLNVPADDAGFPALLMAMLELLRVLGGDDALIVAFEDLHWADASTLDLFDFLARNVTGERVVLVGTYRGEAINRDPRLRQRFAELVRVPTVTKIQLVGLSRDEIAAQVDYLLQAVPSAGLLDDIASRGQGNPLFTEELVAAHLNDDALPRLLSDLFTAEVMAASPMARAVLDALATIARPASQDLIVATVNGAERAVEDGLRESLEAQLLTVDRDSHLYRFRHPLIGEVVYDAALPSERRRLHAAVARALTKWGSARVDSGELALHLERAGDHRGAVVASLAAVDALERMAPAAALVQLERAFALWQDTDRPVEDRLRRLWQAAELATAAGDNPRATELARIALALGTPPRGAAWGFERLGRYLWAQGELEASAAAYQQAVSQLAVGDDSPDAAAVYAGLAQADLMLCRFDTAGEWSRRAIAIAGGNAEDRTSWVTATHLLGLVHSQRGEHDRAIELCRVALAGADRVAVPVRLLAGVFLTLALMAAGRYDEALPPALDGAAEAHRAGLEASYAAYLAGAAAESLVRVGRWQQADAVLRDVAGIAPIPIALTRLSAAQALLAARRGAADRAGEFVDTAVAARVGPYHHRLARATGAEALLAAQRWTDAVDLAREAAPGGAGPASRTRLALVRTVAAVERELDARAHGAAAETGPLIDELTQLVADARPTNEATAFEQAESAHALAALTLLGVGDAELWGAAAAAWQRAGDPWNTAVTQMYEALAAAGAGAFAHAEDALRAAYQTAVSLGAASLVDRVESIARGARLRVGTPPVPEVGNDVAPRLGLTPREAEVLGLVAGGLTNREIGEKLFVSEKTASVHVSNILRKLGVTSRVEAAAVAQRASIGQQHGVR